MTRRELLKSALVVSGAATAGLAWRANETTAFTSCEGSAYQPWCGWPHGSGLRFAATAAILAASPHNTQPWRFRITDRRVDLFADSKRTIGTIDPLLREQHIGTVVRWRTCVWRRNLRGPELRNSSMILTPPWRRSHP